MIRNPSRGIVLWWIIFVDEKSVKWCEMGKWMINYIILLCMGVNLTCCLSGFALLYAKRWLACLESELECYHWPHVWVRICGMCFSYQSWKYSFNFILPFCDFLKRGGGRGVERTVNGCMKLNFIYLFNFKFHKITTLFVEVDCVKGDAWATFVRKHELSCVW